MKRSRHQAGFISLHQRIKRNDKSLSRKELIDYNKLSNALTLFIMVVGVSFIITVGIAAILS